MTDVLTADDESVDASSGGVPPDKNLRHMIEAFGAGLLVAAIIVGIVIALTNNGSSTSQATPSTKPISATKRTATTAVTVPAIRTATDAAEQLYFAWQRGDRVGATKIANSQAITGIFAIKTTAAAGLAFGGCTKPVAGSSSCKWTKRGVQLTMRVNAPGTGAPQVQSVEMR